MPNHARNCALDLGFLDADMDRDIAHEALRAEQERLVDETTAIAGSLRIDFEDLLEQVRNLCAHSNLSSARTGARLAPSVASIRAALARLEALNQAKGTQSMGPVWSAKPKTETSSKRVGKRLGVVEIL
jgi:uncharacterized membrane-anchored protein